MILYAIVFAVAVAGPLLGFAAGYRMCMKQVRERLGSGE